MTTDAQVAPVRRVPLPRARRAPLRPSRPLPRAVDLPASVHAPLPRTRQGRNAVTLSVDLLAAGASSSLVLPGQSPTGGPLAHGAVAVLWVLLLSGARCYAPGPLAGGSGGLRRVLRAATALVAVLAVAPSLAPGLVPRAAEPGHLLLLGASSAAVAVWQRSHLVTGPGRRHPGRTRPPRAIVVGHGRHVTRVVAELAADPWKGLQVSAVCVPASSSARFDVPVVRGFDLLPNAVTTHGAEVVVVLPCHHFDPPTLRRLGWQLENAGVHLVVASGLLDVTRARARTVRAGGLHLVHVRHAELTGVRRIVKQLWERPAAALALVLLGPGLAVLALAVRLDSPGPAFFRQVRTGKDGQPFVMIKMRTMTVDAEQRLEGLTADHAADHSSTDVLFKMRSDPRVTRLGRWLRRYSIDELPQLVNVVRGEMSLVGPRPALGTEVLEYDGDTLRRLAVRPGMTGLWQVSGRSDLPWDQTVRLDLSYVDNWSLSLDAVIIVRTLRAVLGHRGAY